MGDLRTMIDEARTLAKSLPARDLALLEGSYTVWRNVLLQAGIEADDDTLAAAAAGAMMVAAMVRSGDDVNEAEARFLMVLGSSLAGD